MVDTLPPFPKRPKCFINKNITLYGGSGTGKSTIILDLMHILKNDIPSVFVFGGEGIRKTYVNHVPDANICHDLTKEGFGKIVERQKYVTKLYEDAHNISNLKKVFNKVATAEEKNEIHSLKLKIEKKTQQINSAQVSKLKKRDAMGTIKKKGDLALERKYIKIILLHKRNSNLSKTDKTIIKYLNVNPRILLIFDDCVSIMEDIGKDRKLVKTAFEGRHSNITFILSMQNVTKVPAEIRQNSMFLIFTSGTAVNLFFTNKAAGETHKKKIASKYADDIFKNKTAKYCKMVYKRDGEIFYWYVAEIHDPFKFGSQTFWKLANSIPKREIKVPEHYL